MSKRRGSGLALFATLGLLGLPAALVPATFADEISPAAVDPRGEETAQATVGPPSAELAGSTVEIIRTTDGHIGAGIQVRPGLIITAAHVVRDDVSVTVRDDKGRVLVGMVGAKDIRMDLAVVNLTEPQLVGVTPLYCGMPRVGSRVTMVGHPMGRAFQSMQGTVVSGLRRISQWPALILVNHRALPGMSGGPVLGRDGKVVAMVVAATGRRGRTNGPAGAVPGSIICNFLPAADGLSGVAVDYP
jgi:S1-C subfamily serine protease